MTAKDEKNWAQEMSTETFYEKLDAGEELPFRAMGDSMRPLYPSGTIFFIRKVEIDSLQPGDLVLLRQSELLFLHRFIKMKKGRAPRLLTKGDRLAGCDEPWPLETLLGKAVSVVKGEQVVSLEGRLQKLQAELIARISPTAGQLLRIAQYCRHIRKAN